MASKSSGAPNHARLGPAPCLEGGDADRDQYGPRTSALPIGLLAIPRAVRPYSRRAHAAAACNTRRRDHGNVDQAVRLAKPHAAARVGLTTLDFAKPAVVMLGLLNFILRSARIRGARYGRATFGELHRNLLRHLGLGHDRHSRPDDPPTIAARTGNGVGPGLAITTAQGAGAEIFNVAPTTLPMRLAQFV
jgi:hypothetical protein